MKASTEAQFQSNPDLQAQQRELPPDVVLAFGTERLSNIEYVSEGATSSVFSARDEGLGKRVAIKLLKNADAVHLISFQTEAKTACKLDHPNLVRIFNFGVTAQNHAYLIMEFVDGKDLEEIVEASGPLPLDVALDILIQICQGIAHAHSKGIVHRDLKTSNVLIQGFNSSEDPKESVPPSQPARSLMRAVVVDFGLAKENQSQGQTTRQTASGKIKGSPLYISPEQAQGRHGDMRSDIYSLGCIAVKIITGRTPFYADDIFDLLRKHIEEKAPKLEELKSDVEPRPGLEACIERMLEKSPKHRFQTIQEVEETLRAIRAAGLKSQASETSSSPQPISQLEDAIRGKAPPSVQRRMRPLALIVSALLIVVAILCAQLSQNKISVVECLRTAIPLLDRVLPSTKLATSELPAEKEFARLFRYEVSDFLSHHEWPHISPLQNLTLTNDDLDCLVQMHLPTSNIDLSHTKISDEGIRKLVSIPHLKLDLGRINLRPEDYDAIASLKQLEGVSFSGTKITAKDLARLKDLKNIVEIDLDLCPNVEDECLKIISNYSNLQMITLRDSAKVGDEGVIALAKKCPKLVGITLDGTQITDKAIDSLMSNKNIIEFRLNRCKKVTVRSLKNITSNYPHLEFLGIGFIQAKSKDLHYVLNCPNLTYLEILGMPLGDEELKILGGLKKLEYVYLSDIHCSPEGLKNLYSWKNLRLCTIVESKLSPAWVEDLQAHLPRAIILSKQGVPTQINDMFGMFLDQETDPAQENDANPLEPERNH